MKRKKLLIFACLTVALMGCSSNNKSSSNNTQSSSETTTSNITSSEDTSETSTTNGNTSTTPKELDLVTIAEFLRLKDSNTFYTLQGKITSIENATYGDFYLQDATGSVLVYGLYPSKNSTDNKAFSSLGLKVGDEIKIAGKYHYFETKKQEEVQNAYFIELVKAGSGESTNHKYTDFTTSEKNLFNSKFGLVIPFLANDEYYVEEVNDEYGYAINYYTYGNSSAEFNAYRTILATQFDLDGTEEDFYGDTWYLYSKGNLCIDVSYYLYENEYIVDLYLYDGDDSGLGGGNVSEGDILKNTGKGLPTSTTGVYDVDFTKATYVKDVHDQGYYLDGCPTTGNVNVLVLPVEFSDVKANSKGYNLNAIDLAFNGGANADLQYRSVSQFYKEASYGKLNLHFDVLDKWYSPSKNSSYYLGLNEDTNPDQMIIDEILKQLEPTMDLSKYDSDNNGTIDAIVVVNTLDIDSSDNGNIMQWAYRYWNMYADNSGNYYTYDNVYANDYLWSSYQFLFETDYGFNGSEPTNTYTFIHEFGHVLGADDYYDTNYTSDTTSGPLDGHDIMDYERGDHNPYSKFNYGWLTTSRLVVADSTITLDLEDFSKNGDTIIIANNWDVTLGAYQEYYVLMYYTNNGLNAGSGNGYFSQEGIVMYHVNSSLYKELYEGEIYYDVYNNNDQGGQYKTPNNLIELVKTNGSYVLGANATSSSSLTDDEGNKISYSFKVNSLSNGKANITFTKNN